MSTKKKPSPQEIKIQINGNANGTNIIIGNDNAINSGASLPKATKTLKGTLPSGSHIPFPRNRLFTGRVTDLENLVSILTKTENITNIVISQGITGMGGIGKTQLAVEFAYLFGHLFKGVHWLDLRDPSALESQIALCGTHMGLTHTDQREQVAATLKTWQNESPRLLILDNFEDIEQSNDILARFQHPSLRVLVTSRRKDFPKSTGLQMQEINLFSEEESLDFLQKTLDKSKTDEERKKLANQLGYLPLALELSASYINIIKISIADYIKQLDDLITHESMQEEWFKELDITSPTKHDLSLLRTFQFSWQEVKDETQQKIFMIAGYCAPNTPIPIEIFKETLTLDDKELSKAFYRLNALGLLHFTERLPTIHPLLGEFSKHNDNNKHEFPKVIAKVLTSLSYKALTTEILSNFLPLRPHVEKIATYLENSDQQLAGSLWNNYGNHLRDYGDYEGSKLILKHALLLCENSFGTNHPVVANVLGGLGAAYLELDELQNAHDCFEHALKISVSANGYNHLETARDLSNLGQVLRLLSDLINAEKCLKLALEIDKSLLGESDITIAKDLNNLAFVFLDQGNLLESKEMIERCIQIYDINAPTNHLNKGIALHNLGGILKDLGEYKEAKMVLEQAVNILQLLLPPNHPKTQITKNNLQWIIEKLK